MNYRHFKLIFRIIIYVLAIPIFAFRYFVKGIRGIRSIRFALATSIHCCNCGNQISLVGIWKCRCGYTYRGHVLRRCPRCRRSADLVRCSQCQVTVKLV